MKIKEKNIVKVMPILVFSLLIFGCTEKLPEINSFQNSRFNLVNIDNQPVVFPEIIKGKIAVVGYIFTNCPDICPMTTNNMRLIQEKIIAENIGSVEFVSISFDPENDTPEVLRKFAEIRNLNLKNWNFLTGQKTIIDSLINKADVFAVPGDSTILKNRKKIYYYIHTDRIQLIDQRGIIRKNYQGSKINIDEIVTDIINLK